MLWHYVALTNFPKILHFLIKNTTQIIKVFQSYKYYTNFYAFKYFFHFQQQIQFVTHENILLSKTVIIIIIINKEKCVTDVQQIPKG